MFVKYYQTVQKFFKFSFWALAGLSAFLFFKDPFWVMILFGIEILIIGITSLILQSQLKKYGILTTGKVVKIDSDGESDTPIVQFSTQTNEIIEGEPILSFSFYANSYSLTKYSNEDVNVVYYPERPLTFILDSYSTRNAFGLAVFSLAGMAGIIFGILNLK